ncbi:MAG TPA: NosD domain-containing protein, partial [Candidatus Nanoarchaeia archaeon]|nr:NosD domain-containing protein [Candidatus Nanoarchaeia archaeon]
MSHERVVEKRGKTYGPYLYESYRDEEGKVKKRYLGKVEEKKKSNPIFLLIILGLALLSVFLNIGNLNLTGNVTLSLDEVYESNQILNGKILFVLQQSELIPADTQLIINSAGSEHIYSLNDLISESPIEGDFYIQGENISGSGLGYGIEDNRFPIVSFILGIYDEVSSNETYTLPIERPENQTQPNETGQRTISGEAVLSFLPRLIGYTTLELIEEVEANVSADSPFVYELEEGELAQIISSEQPIDLVINGNQAIVTTEYLGDEVKTLEINLTSLDIPAQDGDLVVRLVYDGEEIESATREIYLTPEESEILNETNETLYTLPVEEPRYTITSDNVSNCGTLNIANNVYILNQSLTSSGTCIIIGADNITLDCDGHSITGTSTGNGISNNGYDNITIKNCNISNFSTGIILTNAVYNNTIFNNTLRNMGSYGVSLYVGGSVNVSNNISSNSFNNSAASIYLSIAYGNVIKNNNISNTGIYDGITLSA